MRLKSIQFSLVESFPDRLEPGMLYVSLRFASASHLCCCGCGREVVTPLTPTDWKLIFDRESVSLYPSIGNWSFPCRSHYWIRANKVLWAEDWPEEWIQAARTKDTRAKQRHFSGPSETKGATPPSESEQPGRDGRSLTEWLRNLYG